MVGTYAATDSERLIFYEDTRVVHSRVTEQAVQRVLLGYAKAGRGTPGQLTIHSPDASPFLGTRFEVNAEFTEVTVQWMEFGQSNAMRPTRFERADDR
jgi:hypothetical protein